MTWNEAAALEERIAERLEAIREAAEDHDPEISPIAFLLQQLDKAKESPVAGAGLAVLEQKLGELQTECARLVSAHERLRQERDEARARLTASGGAP